MQSIGSAREGLLRPHGAQYTSMRTPLTPPDQTWSDDQPPSPGGQAPTPSPPAPRVAESGSSRATSSGQAEQRQIASEIAEVQRIAQQLEIFEATSQRRAHWRTVVTTLLALLFGLLEVLVLLRFLLQLFGATPTTSFLRVLYDLSHLLTAPFAGLVPDPLPGSSDLWNDQAPGSQGLFELSTLLALLSYALLTWLIVWLVRTALRPRPVHSERWRDPRRKWR